MDDDDDDYITEKPPKTIEKVAAELALDEPHLRVFSQALSNILNTEIAETTFAQIVDGLPLADVAFSIRGRRDTKYDPVFKHTQLCPGAVERARAFREEFDPARLAVEEEVGNVDLRGLPRPLSVGTADPFPQTLRRYGTVPVRSRAFRVPFIELVAVAVHEIATLLFKAGSRYHKDEERVGERPRGKGLERLGIATPPPFPTPFTLPWYAEPDQYPDGVAALPGYWAEDRIFGGVVLFQRDSRESPVCRLVAGTGSPW